MKLKNKRIFSIRFIKHCMTHLKDHKQFSQWMDIIFDEICLRSGYIHEVILSRFIIFEYTKLIYKENKILKSNINDINRENRVLKNNIRKLDNSLNDIHDQIRRYAPNSVLLKPEKIRGLCPGFKVTINKQNDLDLPRLDSILYPNNTFSVHHEILHTLRMKYEANPERFERSIHFVSEHGFSSNTHVAYGFTLDSFKSMGGLSQYIIPEMLNKVKHELLLEFSRHFRDNNGL